MLDVLVIGAGPAGLYAADRLSCLGFSVTVVDQMASPARKFLMAGRGGLNLTHSEELPRFLSRYREAASFLGPLIEEFPPKALIDWCHGLGQETFIGSSGRVFPKTMKASPLLRALMQRLEAQGVQFLARRKFVGLERDGVLLTDTEEQGLKKVSARAVLLALGRQSNLFIVNKLSTGFIEIIRGVPLITLIFVATVLMKYFLPSSFDLDPVLAVMVLVTLFTAAYIAEVIRGGLAALPKGQYEAADALGLNYWQAQRLIILPQALKISIPGIVSNFISVFKDTTLVSIVALDDPLGISGGIRSDSDWNGIVWELYGFIAIVFWLFCFSMSRYSMWLERQLQTGHR